MRRRALLSGKKSYSQEYFTMVVTVGGDITWTGSTNNNISYSKDNGSTWKTIGYIYGNTTISVAAGDKVLWKGTPTPQSGIGTFSGNTNVRYSVEGNAMSLLFGDNFKRQTSLSGKNYALCDLFASNKNVTSAENLSLPATTLASACYKGMFRNCDNLTTAPKLPAITLADSCYEDMFHGCTNLTTAPNLSATTLASICYGNMFSGCTSLTIAPQLPATTLTYRCYYQMFYNCTSLTTTPQLPAITLADSCYADMFHGCTNLTTAPKLPATTLADSCYRYMFNGCTSLTTTPQLPAITLADSCYEDMFSNTNILPDCTNINFSSQSVVASGGLKGLFGGTKITDAQLDTILKGHGINNYSLPVTTLASECYKGMFRNCDNLTTAPKLPATTLADSCYALMFQYCDNLTTAPKLPATTLADRCYYMMFFGCIKLNSIKCLATDISATYCTTNWVRNVASSGTFTKASSMSGWSTGYNGIPSSWTIKNA